MKKRDFFFEDKVKRENGGAQELQQSRRRSSEELLEQARKAEDARDIMAAIDYCQEALTIDPQYSDARIYSRHLARKKEGCEAALDDIRHSRTMSLVDKANLLKTVRVGFQNHPEVIALSAIILPRLKEHDRLVREGMKSLTFFNRTKAQRYFELAHDLDPGSSEAQYALTCAKNRELLDGFEFTRPELQTWYSIMECMDSLHY